jgi:gliding-associated putative ABC transporter substrate-binding component GldG
MGRVKRTSYGTGTATAVLVLAVLALVNFLSYRRFARLDLTEAKEYTVSRSTKDVLGDLDDVVNLTLYFSKKLPPYMGTLRDRVMDMLSEYRAYGRGNVELNLIDPADDPEMERKVRMMGIPQVQLDIIEKDKRQVTNAYLGLAILYGDSKEVIPVIRGTRTLEYELTSSIVKVTAGEPMTIGIVSRYAQETFGTLFQQIHADLLRQYEIRRLELGKGEGVPEEISTLILLGPKDLSERQRFEIDQYLMRGGKLVALVDAMELSEIELKATTMNSGVNDLLEHYGIRVNADMVLDQKYNSMAGFARGFMHFAIPYVFWPKVVRSGFDQENPVVNRLEGLTLAWTSSLESTISAPDSGEAQQQLSILAKSSEQSWTTRNFSNLDPSQRLQPQQSALKQHNLVAVVHGTFESFFAGKDIPPRDTEEGDAEEPEPEPVEEELISESPTTSIFVVGNSNFINDRFVQQFPENKTFFLNAVDHLTMGDRLIGIRSRPVMERPLKEISEKEKAVYRFLGTYAIAILVAVFGLVRLHLRRQQKKMFEEMSRSQER